MRQSTPNEGRNAAGFFKAVGKSLLAGIQTIKDAMFMEEEDLNKDMPLKANSEMSVPETTIPFTTDVLDEIRRTVGSYPAESGGLFAASPEGNCFDRFYFDSKALTNLAYFEYDVASCSVWMHERAKEGRNVVYIIHSHPKYNTYLSYHDISTGLIHMDFFNADEYYLPIVQPKRDGCFEMYQYRLRRENDNLLVTLAYKVQAMRDGSYSYLTNVDWKKSYSIPELRSYRESTTIGKTKAKVRKDVTAKPTAPIKENMTVTPIIPTRENVAVKSAEPIAEGAERATFAQLEYAAKAASAQIEAAARAASAQIEAAARAASAQIEATAKAASAQIIVSRIPSGKSEPSTAEATAEAPQGVTGIISGQLTANTIAEGSRETSGIHEACPNQAMEGTAA